MTLELAGEEDLLDRIADRPHRVVYLVGATVTAPSLLDDRRIVELIRQRLGSAAGRFEELLASQPEDRARVAWRHLERIGGQDSVNHAIRRVVLAARRPSARFPLVPEVVSDEQIGRALEDDGDGWALSPGVAALGRILARAPSEPRPLVLTTNFDPLLRVSVARAGGVAQSVAFDSDGGFHNIAGAGCLIGQLRGDWCRGDVRPVPAQIGETRPRLEASLQRLIAERTLVVLGHDGTDDVLIRSLIALVRGTVAPFDVLWTFAGADAAEIGTRHAALLAAFRPGIERGRVCLYGGIDVQRFLPRLAARLLNAETEFRPELGSGGASSLWRPIPRREASGSRVRAEVRVMIARRVVHREVHAPTLELSIGARYTELEAEVEVEGGGRITGLLRRRVRGGSLRLEPSLTRAIERSSDRVILLEGEPGCGKTVALHQAERKFAKQIASRPGCSLLLPLCVKLRNVASGPGRPIDKIWACVLRSLDPDPAEARRLFELGAHAGGWLLLLDGFDELPEVLGAIEATEEIWAYTRAIDALRDELACGTGSPCRIVVATRRYHGPKGLDWPRFHLRPLSRERRAEFVAKFGLTGEQVVALTDHLATETIEIQQWAQNPLMLAMLCEIVKAGQAPPRSVHALFEGYLGRRFVGDTGRVRELYGGPVAHLRRAAEEIGFVMSAEAGLGLSPTIPALRTALRRHGFADEGLERTLEAIDALELVLRETRDGAQHTGFRHRRLQEYFATCVFLREPDRVEPARLLFDAPWRESLVVWLQRRSQAELAPLLACIEAALRAYHETLAVPRLVVDPAMSPAAARAWTLEHLQTPGVTPQRLRWPQALVHVLGILQAGFADPKDLPPEIQQLCIDLVLHEYRAGARIDKKAALAVAGVLPVGVVEGLAHVAFERDSELLQDLAFKQLPRIGVHPSASMRQQIGRLLVRMARSGKLADEREATFARIRRTQDETLTAMFGMASAAVTCDRIVRRAMFVLFVAIYVPLAFVIFMMPLGPGELSWSGRYILVGLLVMPAIAAMRIHDVSRNGRAIIRMFFDLLVLMTVTFPLLGLGVGSFFVWLVLSTYAYVWPLFALVAVRMQMHVTPRAYVVLPFLLAWQAARQRPAGAVVVFLLLAGFVAAQSGIPAPSEEWETFVVLVVVPLTVLVAVIVTPHLLRAGWIGIMDGWRTWRRGRRSRVLSGGALRSELAGYHLAESRNALLRETLVGRRVALAVDEVTRSDVEATLVALERHADAVEQGRGRAAWYSFRVRLPDAYINNCTSEYGRWCREHCSTIDSSTELTTTIDLLTRLLDNLEQALQMTRPGAAHPVV